MINHEREEQQSDEEEYEERVYSPSKRQVSPVKQEPHQYGDYPSFSVAFGITESKFKRNLSPQNDMKRVVDIPKKKRVDHVNQTYDVIRGMELKSTKNKSLTQTMIAEFGSIRSGLSREFTEASEYETQGERSAVNKESSVSSPSDFKVKSVKG